MANGKPKRQRYFWLVLGALALLLLSLGTAFQLGYRPRPLRIEVQREIFQGVTYFRSVRQEPRPVVVHGVWVDLRQAGISLFVTPGEDDSELPFKARTTAQFLTDFDVQVAINGDFFTPWHSKSVFWYYPHPGDAVTTLGISASNGKIYTDKHDSARTLYFSEDNQASFGEPEGAIAQAISGNLWLVNHGRVSPDIPSDQPEPRTAIGLDQDRNRLLLVVVDGRQARYSEGVTMLELAEILLGYGAYEAINLDGGGSSTLVMSGWFGLPVTLSSPIDSGIPGRQRPVANHLGVFARR
ncbi:MAG: phosphodiester glycosidase family protein [Chloroflexota bacterium]